MNLQQVDICLKKSIWMKVCLFSDSEAMEVKSSTSISALDAISEAPETEDVDMMSQEVKFFEKNE